MKTSQYATLAALLLAAGAARAGAELTPGDVVFEAVPVGGSSVERVVTVSHRGAGSTSVDGVTVVGTHAGEFTATADCTAGQVLSDGQACAIRVRFTPAAAGTKAAALRVAVSGTESTTLSAFLGNAEDSAHEVRRRIPPVLATLDLPAGGFTINALDTITWSMDGYHPDYRGVVALFKCPASGACGESWSDGSRVADSGLLTPAPEDVTVGEWAFSDQSSQRTTFRYDFTPDTALFTEAATLVLRFYYKSAEDLDQSGLSLLVPGGLPGVSYYGADGRRVQTTVNP